MNYKKVSAKVRNIVKRTFEDESLLSQVIVEIPGGYCAFNDYRITQDDTMWEVQTEFSDSASMFSSSKTALAWCVVHKHGQYNLADRIKLLDWRMTAKQSDIDILSQRLEQSIDTETREMLQCRLSEDVSKRNDYRRQLQKCLETAKYIKIKGPLHHEPSRFNKTGKF